MKTLKTLRVILTLARMQLSSKMMFRSSFWGAFCADLSLFLIQLLFFHAISANGGVAGWNYSQLTVFTGSFIALDGLYMATYFFGVLGIPDQIRTGTLDLALCKPVNTLLFVAFSRIDPGSFALAAAGMLISLYGGFRLHALSAGNILCYLLFLLLMLLLMFALMICLRSAAFWLIRTDSLTNFENTMVDFSFRLPAPAIRGGWRILLFVVLPFGLMANLPAQALFGAVGAGSFALGFGVTAFFSLLAALLWRAGMRRYDSASG